ncbi:MAG: GYF domain-containing protein [Tepidisphaeraceae bacterium]|jgi:TM2 domain-containing membrane protein YozV
MAEEWFYSQNGQQGGPVDFGALQRMAAAGQLHPSDLIWKQGMANWAAASSVGGIFAAPPPPPPPPLAYAGQGTYPPQAPVVVVRPTTDALAMMTFEANKKSMGVAYLLWFFLGGFGAHRFYLGRNGSATAMLVITLSSFVLMFVVIGLFTIWITGIWALVDAFLIPDMCRQFNNRLLSQMAGVMSPQAL